MINTNGKMEGKYMTNSEKVIQAIQSGNLEEVDEWIQLALDEDDEETLYLLGNSLYQLGFLEETKKVYNHLIDINPQDDELKIYLAEIEIEEGNELEALELLHSIENTSSSYTQSLLVQADYYHLNGLPEVSIQKLEEAEELIPQEPVIKFALAEVYFTIAEYQLAVNYYEFLIEEGLEEIAGTLINARLGNAYLMLGNYEKAIENLNEALSFKDDPEVYYQLGFAYIQKEEFYQAIDTLKQAKEMDPSLISVYILLAEAYQQLNDLEQSLQTIEEGLTVNEMNIELYLKAAEYAGKLNINEKASNFYHEALDIEPENERILLRYAEFLNHLDQYEEIIELFEKAPESVRSLPEALWLLATTNNELDEYDQARDYFDQAYNELNDHLDFLKDYAFFLREDGQREKMHEVLERYTSINPEYDEEIASLKEDYLY
ncbi:Tetratricopeptide repeat-containing protein [Atopostipes suicloacalis DSM 15692]|uniref:Tetratricopeptide repeat-containing protein n=2 Tax=Atopostipes suicloacalis TaxID=180295 RepID=A0A1M4UTR1_9LACT|nr:Tetratricopeptide repeat-containing protein [Atopostipes suicloacalis DSM 15692]